MYTHIHVHTQTHTRIHACIYAHACACTHTHIKWIIEKFKTHGNKGRKLLNPQKNNANMEIYYVLIIIVTVIKAKKKQDSEKSKSTVQMKYVFFLVMKNNCANFSPYND